VFELLAQVIIFNIFFTDSNLLLALAPDIVVAEAAAWQVWRNLGVIIMYH